MASSSGKNSRIIEVEVKSAKLSSIKAGISLYVRVSISESQELRTKLVKFTKGFLTTASWNQKFVFSVPQHFVFDDKSTVSFTVFKARKYLPDVPVGKATGEMRALFPVDECEEENHDDLEDIVDYYIDKDDDDDDGAEAELRVKETYELKASAGVPILKDSSVVGTLNVSIDAWEKYYPHQVNLCGRASKSYSICRDSKKVGSMILQKAKQEKCVTFVGHVVKWRNLAMELKNSGCSCEKVRSRQKGSLGMCFACASHSTLD